MEQFNKIHPRTDTGRNVQRQCRDRPFIFPINHNKLPCHENAFHCSNSIFVWWLLCLIHRNTRIALPIDLSKCLFVNRQGKSNKIRDNKGRRTQKTKSHFAVYVPLLSITNLQGQQISSSGAYTHQVRT